MNKTEIMKQCCKAYGISVTTVRKVKFIEEMADEKMKEKLRNNEITVNKAFLQLKKRENKAILLYLKKIWGE